MINSISVRFLWIVIVGLSSVYGGSYAQECPTEDLECCCTETFPEERISLSHVEGSGLGYSIGYSSLDVFLSHPFNDQKFVPFLDLRGHIFNNGKYAGNAGLGFRYFNECSEQIWGANVVYDYLENSRRSYHQVGAGFEVIGDRWDIHVNGYVPVGDKKTNIYRFNYAFFEELKREDFSHFDFDLRAREQLALNGVDALFGYRLLNIYCADLHVSAGPYYYWGRSEKTKNAFVSKYESALGGRLSLDILFKKYVSLIGVMTYDSIFKWRGQGMIALNIPFDLFFGNCHSECTPCSLKNRLYDNIQRNEIIAIDSLTRFTNDPRVLDPEFQP